MNDNILWHDPLARPMGGAKAMRYDPLDYYHEARSPFAHIVGTKAPKSKKKFGNKKKGILRIKTNSKLTKDVDVCKKAIKNLRQQSDASLGSMTYRKWQALKADSEEMKQGVDLLTIVSKTLLEDIVDKLLFFDPATASSLKNVDLTASSYSKDILIKYLQATMELRNNYQVDCRVKVYLVEAKGSTSVNASSAWTNGIADNAFDTSGSATVTSVTQVSQYPTDYNLFNDLYKSTVLKDIVLKAGQSTSVKHAIRDVEYDPAYADTQSNGHQKVFKSFGFLIVTQGTASHDSSVVELGIGQSALDCDIHVTAKVEYDAGINVDYVVIDDSIIGSFSNGAVQANRPISDNQGFSLA